MKRVPANPLPKAATSSGRKSPLPTAVLARLERLRLGSRRRSVGRFSARRRSARLGRGMEFAGHRPYTPGDDFKDVDWTLYGRLDRFYVRQSHEETELDATLLVDVSASMESGGSSGRACDVAMALAWVGLSRLDRIRVAPFAQELLPTWTPPKRKAHALSVHSRLTSMKPGSKSTDLARSVAMLASTTLSRGLVLLISDFLHPWRRGVDLLRASGFEPVLVQLINPQVLRYGDLLGVVSLVDAETGEELRVDLEPRLVRRYQDELQSTIEAVGTYARGLGLGFAQLSTEGSFDAECVSGLVRGGVLI